MIPRNAVAGLSIIRAIPKPSSEKEPIDALLENPRISIQVMTPKSARFAV